MRTRKLLVPLIVCCLCMGHVLRCQGEERRDDDDDDERAKIAAKLREKSSAGNIHRADFLGSGNRRGDFGDYDEEDEEEEDVEDEETERRAGRSSREANSSIYRNNRSIDASGSAEGQRGKSGQQSTPSNLPRDEPTKPRHPQRHRERYKKPKKVMIGDGICQSIDIRNTVDNFDLLKDCRVIEGFLQIVLMDKNNTEEDFRALSFPVLREITGYFLVYRVDKLKTLNGIFPNLEVIRGDTLLADYSFMIYENQHLQEIGLNKLTEISRGAVRVEKNPSLCYTSNLDWNAIVVAGENFIKDNGKVANCPVCTQCPGGRCWTAHNCQMTEKPSCNDQCLGECFGKSEQQCYVCKNFQHEGKCVKKCPDHLFAYLSRRCITREQCVAMNNFQRHKPIDSPNSWRPFNGTCLTQCPNGYEDAIDKNGMLTCQTCTGRCQKIGQSAIIRHISDAQVFRGTTIVKGALEFQIRNGHPNIFRELTEAFGMVEEISDYLKVTHSFPISSLAFFKKLRVIKGEKLDINNASLVVLDNPNLSNLFPDDQRVEIQNGRLFFHYNPKLCMSKILRLGRAAGIANISDVEVQPESNGEKVACDIVNININVRERGPNYANLVWDVYVPEAGQSLLSYLLNYIETESEQVSYEGNSCGNNTWQILDVEIPRSDSPSRVVEQRLTDLKPYTKYAVYVKTFAARSKRSPNSQTGQSEIIFFRTESDVPSVPTDVRSFATGESEITVRWSAPEFPNGPIGYYVVAGFLRLEDERLPQTRDYCLHGLTAENENEQQTIDQSLAKAQTSKKSCCMKSVATIDGINTSSSGAGSTSSTAVVAEPKTPRKFEIFCLENMTISSLSTGRKNYCYSSRYAAPNFQGFADDHSTPGDAAETIDDTRTRMWNGTYYSFVFNTSANASSYVIDKLRHFSLYTLSVSACGEKLLDGRPMCSSIEYTNTRTRKRPGADDVRGVDVRVTNNTIVNVAWDAPRDPNGLTVAYTIEYANLLVKDAKATTECVRPTGNRRRRAVHHIRNLSPGRYSVRVRSTSLAGDGAYSAAVTFSIGLEDDNTAALAALLTVAALLVALVAGCLVVRSRRRKRQQERLIASVNPDYIETRYVRDGWEVPRESIELLEELGLGNFGMVYRGVLEGARQVAVKTISATAGEREKNEFLNEASVMKNFSTYHIIRLLGVVSEGAPPYVIMELMENGDLKTYLRGTRDSARAPDVARIIRMAGEIADGMAYLESKKFVHRDLAARNCMVSRDLVCKIGDFGMARDIYETDYYKIGKKGLLPIRWMAPENLSDGVFTSDSDVWSYGVVLYEILTLAEIPYQGFSNEEVLNYVLRRGTVGVPRNCPEMLAKIMDKCFKWRPSDRPTFMELVAELEPFISQDFCEKSFYHSDEGVEIRNLGLKKVYHHAAPIRFHWGTETARWVREFEDNVTLLDQTKAGTSRGRIFRNGFQHFGNHATTMEDVPLDR